MARLLRSVLVPLVVALPPLFWVVSATDRASRTPFGRDQGIFQYVGWALLQGQVDYRDIRDVNGPLTHFIHAAFLLLGGGDEHRFRVLDLAVTGATFALVGACLPGLLRRPSARTAWLERAAWALAAWVVLSGQYLLYLFWDLAQRESFFDWFLLPSVALQLAGLAPSRRPGRRRALLAVAGALSVLPWFGKPTFALFTVTQLACLVASELGVSRRRAAAAFLAGGAGAAAVAFALLAVVGDPFAYLRIQLSDVPAFYRFIWPRTAADIFSSAWAATPAALGIAGALLITALVALGEMPRRALVLAPLPICALAAITAQAKGFPYHFHPLTSTVSLQWLALVAWLTERARVSRRIMAAARWAPVVAGLALALHVEGALEQSPHIRQTWLLRSGYTAESRATRGYFAQFPEPDFFPFEMRQAAAYLHEATGPADRVQMYGMDPYVLFLAKRLSATPYIYGYDLDVDAALAGGAGGVPDEAQAERIRAIQKDHETDLLTRLEAHPPAAFVFLDHSPLFSELDAWEDFGTHCARAAAWVSEHYRETARFGHDHVWLRSDVTAPPLKEAPPDNDGDRVTWPEGP